MKSTELKDWRTRNNVSQKMLMQLLGYKTIATISMMENDKQPIPKVVVLALATVERILNGK